MSTDLALPAISSIQLSGLAEQASGFLLNASSANTRKAYAGDVERFSSWCAQASLSSLPAEPTTVGLYLTHLANSGKRVSTITRALASIVSNHRAHGHPWPKGHPAIADLLKGIRRTLGTAPQQKAPVMDQDLVHMVGTLPHTLEGIRDRALLTVGWFGAFRRSELASLQFADVRFVNDGVIVTLTRSKTDQDGKGYEKGLPYAGMAAVCPVRSLRAWLEASSISSGPLFGPLCDRTVARIIQRAAKAAGVTTDIGGHSLRSGFMTSAAAKGKDMANIMRQSGHRSDRVARGYIRHASLFTNSAAAGIL